MPIGMAADFPTHIETQRLILRPPVLQDAEIIFASYCQDPAVCRHMVWVPHTSLEVTHQFVKRCIAEWDGKNAFPYVITRKTDAQVLGMLEVRQTEFRANIGYVLSKAYWGQGLMPEAIRSLVDIAFSSLSYFRVEATCDIENKASIRTLEKSGFIREGRLARYMVHPNLSAEPRDCWMYAVSKPQMAAR